VEYASGSFLKKKKNLMGAFFLFFLVICTLSDGEEEEETTIEPAYPRLCFGRKEKEKKQRNGGCCQ
jgi:hypothetical protein